MAEDQKAKKLCPYRTIWMDKQEDEWTHARETHFLPCLGDERAMWVGARERIIGEDYLFIPARCGLISR